MSNAIQVFLEMQGIDAGRGDVGGRRKDLDEVLHRGESTLQEINALAASGVTPDDVAGEIQKTSRLGSELIKYIARTKTTA